MEKKLNQDNLYLMSLGVCATEFNILIYPLIEKMLTTEYPGFTRLANLTKRKKQINFYIRELLVERHFRSFEYLKIDNQIIPFIKLGKQRKRVEYPIGTEDFFGTMYSVQQSLINPEEDKTYDFFKVVHKYEGQRSKHSNNEMHYDLNYWNKVNSEAKNTASHAIQELDLISQDMGLYGVDRDYLNIGCQIIPRQQNPHFVPFVPKENRGLCASESKQKTISFKHIQVS